MFNDILTGKASLEEKPKQDPYREQSVPNVTVPCQQCHRDFTKQATSPTQICVQCQLDNAARQAAMMPSSYESPEKSDAGMQVLKVFGYIALIGLLIWLKWTIRHG